MCVMLMYIYRYLYIMTFGSFIGFSSAFPKLIVDLFDEYGDDECAELQAAAVDGIHMSTATHTMHKFHSRRMRRAAGGGRARGGRLLVPRLAHLRLQPRLPWRAPLTFSHLSHTFSHLLPAFLGALLGSRSLVHPSNRPPVHPSTHPPVHPSARPPLRGALIGSLIRPVGGIMSDKWGGARVTHYHTLLMTAVTFALGVIVKLARLYAVDMIR